MSSNTAASASAAAATPAAIANHALMAVMAKLEKMIEEVLRCESEEEKMELSRKIALEVVCLRFSLIGCHSSVVH